MLIFFLVLLAIVPTVVFLTTSLAAPDFLGDRPSRTFSFYSGMAGTFFSYYGLLITAYALVEIKNLSGRHFFKVRAPEIRKLLDAIAKEMSDMHSELAEELKTMKFMSQVPSALRLAKRLNSPELRKISKEARRKFASLKDESESYNLTGKCGQVKGYWDMHQKIRELSEEIKAQLSDMKVN